MIYPVDFTVGTEFLLSTTSYKILGPLEVLKDSAERIPLQAFILEALRNRSNLQIRRDGIFVKEFLEILSAPEEIIIPQSLTPRQIRKVLTDSGLRQAVENMVATSSDYDLKDWWEYSLYYERTHPKLVEAAYALGLTDEQIDQMFIAGAAL